MKSKHILAIFAVLTLVVGAGFISYGFMDDDAAAPLKKDEPEMKRIQIIRSYQGQVSTFDTLVPAGSGYTEHDFLAELGFEDDKNLSFIRVSGDMLDMDMDFSDFHCVTKGESGDHDWNGNSFHMKLDLGELEEEINELKAEELITKYRLSSPPFTCNILPANCVTCFSDIAITSFPSDFKCFNKFFFSFLSSSSRCSTQCTWWMRR